MPVERFSESIYYMAIGFTKMFGYIGIGGAFIYTAYPENRKKTASTIIPLVVTASLAGITEPIDFMFIFAAPLLYAIHAVIAGLFIAMLKVFDIVALWNGNLLASIVTNIANASKGHNVPMMFVMGALQALVYFVVFTALIKKFRYHTPGREGDPLPAGEAAAQVQADQQPSQGAAKKAAPAGAGTLDGGGTAMDIIEGLGGKANIVTVENCITRLRVSLKDPSLLQEALINKTVNRGIVKKGNDIQIIYGLQVADVRRAVEEQLAKL